MNLLAKIMHRGVIIFGLATTLAGAIGLGLSPFFGEMAYPMLWGVEPMAYIGAVSMIGGLGLVSLAYLMRSLTARRAAKVNAAILDPHRWGRITQEYFELFNHDLGRPMRRVLGKERELRAVLESSEKPSDPNVMGLLDEIERQTPNFRLMMSNIQVLVQLEGPAGGPQHQPVEPSELIRKIVDRYVPVAADGGKEITWWAEPSEFGLVHSDSSTVEHIVTNLVDNAVRFAQGHIEVKLTKNPTHFFVRVWDDGPGIAPQYIRHIFDRGWTPELARREEKTSSGLGLFICNTLASRSGGDLMVESDAAQDSTRHTAFLLSLPLNGQ